MAKSNDLNLKASEHKPVVGVKYQNIVVHPATILHFIGNAIAKAFGLKKCDHSKALKWSIPEDF